MRGKLQTPSEHREDSSAHTKGVYILPLIHNFQGTITFKAYIRGMGIVTITNDGTLNNEFKMKIGNNLRLVPHEDPLYVTPEVYAQLGIPEDQSKKRKAESLVPPAPETVVGKLSKEFAADVTGVYEKVSHKRVEDIPKSSGKIG